MKTTATLLSITAFALGVHAQPTLTQATNAPVVGTQYTFNYGSYIAPGNPGAAQTWNLSTLTSDSLVEVEMLLPSATPNGSQVPNATIAEVNDVVTTYYNVSSDGLYFAGSDDGTSLIVNSPMGKYLPYPCTYGSTWSSIENATFTSDGIDVWRTGSSSGEADGYGTLIMPWGTVQNVLRVHWMSALQDSTQLFNIDYTYDTYLYYVVGQSYPIAELVTASATIFGNTSTNQFSRWTGELSTGVQAPVLVSEALTTYPNPAQDVVNVLMPAVLSDGFTARLVDAAGRDVAQAKGRAPSNGVLGIGTSSLAPGHYTILFTDDRGHKATARFMKQ